VQKKKKKKKKKSDLASRGPKLARPRSKEKKTPQGKKKKGCRKWGRGTFSRKGEKKPSCVGSATEQSSSNIRGGQKAWKRGKQGFRKKEKSHLQKNFPGKPVRRKEEKKKKIKEKQCTKRGKRKEKTIGEALVFLGKILFSGGEGRARREKSKQGRKMSRTKKTFSWGDSGRWPSKGQKND